ncbi:hypothetical protein BC826DRAFT_1110850 [Russula brevipes]|nr:hypothetical protein BC826DRAFT_1110850 [Russula brevipes]
MAASQDAKAKHNAIVTRIAQLEAEEAQQEDDIQRHSQRPDQSYGSSDSFGGQKSSYRMPSSSSRDQAVAEIPRKKMIYDEGDDDEEDQLMLSPPASTVLDDYEEYAIEDVASDDDFQVELGSKDSESDSSDGHDSDLESGQVEKPYKDTTRRARAVKEKTKRGSLRAEVSKARDDLAQGPGYRSSSCAAPNNKRKASPNIQPAMKRLKRCKVVGPQGFIENWRTRIKHVPQGRQGQASRGSSRANTEDGTATRSSTSETRVSLRLGDGIVSESGGDSSVAAQRRTEQMGLELVKKATQAPHQSVRARDSDVDQPAGASTLRASHGLRKPKYTISDLPFPYGSLEVTQSRRTLWRTKFIPSLLDWAGSRKDPFGTNSQMANVVMSIWEQVFPHITLQEQGFEIVLRVCDTALNSWRSDVGKAGHIAVFDFWQANPATFGSAEARKTYVTQALTGLRFLFKDPDAPKGHRGPFCSPLISKVYASHLRRILTAPVKYGSQIGGLALATAAVERGLTLFKSGEDMRQGDRVSVADDQSTRGKANNFTDKIWGEKARQLVKSTSRLDDTNWPIIKAHASVFYNNIETEDEEGESALEDVDDPVSNPHAFIVLDCAKPGERDMQVEPGSGQSASS